MTAGVEGNFNETTSRTALKGILTLLGNMKEIITNIARGWTQAQLNHANPIILCVHP